MKVKIAPSLLAADFSRLGEEISALEKAGADWFHFDVMDGHFVPNISLGLPVIEALRPHTKIPFDAHLMIENADFYLDSFAQVGCNWLSVHIEACPHVHRTLTRIRDLGMKAGIAINPGTALSSLDGVEDWIDYVLVMSVSPGFGGQSFIPSAIQRVAELKKRFAGRNVLIEVDGGIKVDNAPAIVNAGADVLVVGTGLFSARPKYSERLRELRGN